MKSATGAVQMQIQIKNCGIIIIIIIMKMYIVQKYTEKNEKWKIKNNVQNYNKIK